MALPNMQFVPSVSGQRLPAVPIKAIGAGGLIVVDPLPMPIPDLYLPGRPDAVDDKSFSTPADWQMAAHCLPVLRTMREAGTYPDADAFNAWMAACHRTGHIEIVPALFRHLLEDGAAFGLYPNSCTHASTIEALGRLGRIDEALELLQNLYRNGPRHGVWPAIDSVNATLIACIRAERWDEGRLIFRQLEKIGPANGVLPNDDTWKAMRVIFRSAFATAGNTKAKRLLAEGIEHGVLKPSLGMDVIRNRLDLRSCAVFAQWAPGDPAGVHHLMARAIFRQLLADGTIDRHTRFRFAHFGESTLKQCISKCMSEAGWLPAHPVLKKPPFTKQLDVLMSLPDQAPARSA